MVAQYEVGKIYHPGKTSWEQGADFNYRKTESGPEGIMELRLFYNALEPHEIHAVSHGEVRIGYTMARNVLFFLYNFGRGVLVGESSFNWNMVPQQDRAPLPKVTDYNYGKLFIILVDADDGIIRAMRLLSLGLNFAGGLYSEMVQTRLKFDKASYLKAIDRVYVDYPDGHSLFQIAKHQCIINAKASNN